MKVTFPSVNEIAQRSLNTTKRFPFAILSALAATISAICFSEIEYSNTKDYYWLSDMIFVSVLGISLFTGIQTLSESLKWDNNKNIIAKSIGILLLVGYYFLPEGYLTEGANEVFYRYFVLFLISHLFVAFAPFIKNPDVNEFWGYNKTLFLNFLISALYSAVLFFGLSIALLSIDNLLGFDVKDERYMQLWIFLVGIFNTFFFLARVPKMGEFEPSVTEYPKALKVFVQYVLIPIVTIYILILYSYLVKIIVQWELPTGWVANLVLSFSIAGIFSLLLLHPIKDEAKNNWIRLYSKLYYIGLVPLVVLLFVSIGTRISEYGVTINRFYVATLAVWLAGIVIYFIVSKSKNIKVIPISLALIGLGITFGPLSAFSVSERSQKGRLDAVLAEHQMIDTQNLMISSVSKVPISDGREISSIIDYLVENHGLESLQKYFNEDIFKKMRDLESDRLVEESAAEKITRYLGIRYIDDSESKDPNTIILNSFMYGIGNQNALIGVTDYDVHLRNVKFWHSDTTFVSESNSEWRVIYNFKNDILSITNLESGKSIKASFDQVVRTIKVKHPDKIRAPATVPPKDLFFEKENENFKTGILIDDISGTLGDQVYLSILQIDIYIEIKQ